MIGTVAGFEDESEESEENLADLSKLRNSSIHRRPSIMDTRSGSISATLNSGRQVSGVVDSRGRDFSNEDDFQFSLSKFVLDVGKQAKKAVVDGILGRNDFDISKSSIPREETKTPPFKVYRDLIPHWKNIGDNENGEGSIRSLIDLPIPDESIRIYSSYEENSKSPEKNIYEEDVARKRDFSQGLRNATTSVDDVYGMENLARDSIICDVVKDGTYVGISRDTTASEVTQKILTNLTFIESEIVNYTMPVAPSKRAARSIATMLAEPTKRASLFTDDIRSSVITYGFKADYIEDDENILHSEKDNQLKAAAVTASDFNKTLKNLGANAMIGQEAGDSDKLSDIDPIKCEGGFASDSDEDDTVVLTNVNESSKLSDTIRESVGFIPFTRFESFRDDKAVRCRDLESSPSFTVGRNRSTSVISVEGCSVMNNFLTTPNFEESADVDALYSGAKSVVEMLHMPEPAKKKLEEICAATSLPLGLEDEMYKLIANYMFQHTMYARSIGFEKLSRRMSTFTSQADLLQYSSLYSLEELASNLDSILFMTSSEGSGRFYELEDLRRSLDSKHMSYLKELSEFRKGKPSPESVVAAVKELSRKREELLKQSTQLASVLRNLRRDNECERLDDRVLSIPDWYMCPDTIEEEYHSLFSRIQSDLYRRKDNEYVISNTVATMSFFSYHRADKSEIWI